MNRSVFFGLLRSKGRTIELHDVEPLAGFCVDSEVELEMLNSFGVHSTGLIAAMGDLYLWPITRDPVRGRIFLTRDPARMRTP